MSQVEHFDRVSGRYDELRAPPGVTEGHRIIVREAGLAGRRVLDIGCGTGANLRILAEHFGCRVSGIDSSEGMLSEARRKLPDADLRLGVAERLPYSDRSFDGALISLAVHHLDREAAFPEAARVLVDAGRLAIVTPNPDSFPRAWMASLFPSYVEVERARFPSAVRLERDLRAAGFAAARSLGFEVPRRFSREYALERIRGRYASTFDLFSDEEYREGLARAERDLPDPVEYVLELVLVIGTR